MFICICHALTDKDVKTAADKGACRADEVFRHYEVELQCGRCVPVIEGLLKTEREGGLKPLVEHPPNPPR